MVVMSESLAGKQFDLLYSSEVSAPVLEPWRTSSGSAVQFPYPCVQTSITRISGEVSKTVSSSDSLLEILGQT